jgi:hypothetical protein
MAKRTPPEQQDYRPVKEQLVRSVLSRRPPPPESVGSEATVVGPLGPPPALTELTREQSDAPPLVTSEAKPAARGDAPRRGKNTRENDGQTEKSRRKDLTREKRILLTESEEEDIDLLLKAISSELGIRVKFSNVLRACLSLLFHVEPELRKQCKRYGKIGKRPSNNEPTEIAAFEENLARLFDGAVRNTRSLD